MVIFMRNFQSELIAFLSITFCPERGHGILTELMEGSLEGHLKEKFNIYRKIRDKEASSDKETSFMLVPIRVMTNWLRNAFILI